MIPEEKKYERILNILRKSKPVLESTDAIEEKVISMVQNTYQKGRQPFNIFDYLFGWAYIGWVRRSLVTASFFIVFAFVYQQTVILKRINILSKQTIITESQIVTGLSNDIEGKILKYKLTGRKLPTGSITISEKQMEQLLESINELQVQYKDLIKLIEENPELKKYIENNDGKIKL